MKVDDLQRRLAQSLPGEPILLSESEFRAAFYAFPAGESQKQAARRAAADAGCSVLFMGDEGVFAVFTKGAYGASSPPPHSN
jgi:hypothetical protein